jgi:hypothetical protein
VALVKGDRAVDLPQRQRGNAIESSRDLHGAGRAGAGNVRPQISPRICQIGAPRDRLRGVCRLIATDLFGCSAREPLGCTLHNGSNLLNYEVKGERRQAWSGANSVYELCTSGGLSSPIGHFRPLKALQLTHSALVTAIVVRIHAREPSLVFKYLSRHAC